jgi:hypothetical protein
MKTYKSSVSRKLMHAVCLVVWSSSSFFVCQVLADDISNIYGNQLANWERASDAELEQLRGGFALANGVNIDFSLEKIISLNGVETFSSVFQLPENISLLQNGFQNQATTGIGSALGSAIQNNLDGQLIRTVNTINIEVSNLKNLDLNNSNMAFHNFILPNTR